MSGLFSVSKLLGKSRSRNNKRSAVPSSSSASVVSLATDKEATSKSLASSKLSTHVTTAGVDNNAPPTAHGGMLKSTSMPTPKDVQSLKADSIVEVTLPSDNESLRSFYATPLAEIPTIPTPNSHSDPVHAQVHTRSEDGKEEPVSDDEPDYALVSSPEPKPSEEWTQLDNQDTARETLLQEVRDKAAAELGAKTKKYEEELREIAEERNKAQARLTEVEATLKIAQNELNMKANEITSYMADISNLTTRVTTLESEKAELANRLEAEQVARVSETARFEDITSTERKKHEEEVQQLDKKLEDQADKHFDELEDVYDQLQTSENTAEGLRSRNQELETKLLHFENNTTTSKAEEDQKDHEIMLLDMKNTHITTQLLDVQNSLTSMERQNRMLYDQLRQQTNQLRASKNMTTSQSLTSKIGYVMGGGSSNTGPHVDSAVRTMRMLNDDIYQTAASITDQLEAIAIRFVAEPGTRAALAGNLKSTLGTELVTSLERGGPVLNDDDESTFYIQLQTALQGCLIACCMRIITSWYPTEWDYGVFLATMFERICGTEGTEKAKEWRNTVRKNCIPAENLDGKLIAMFQEEILKVFNLSGWTSNPYVDMFKDQRHNLPEMAKLAIKLNQETAVGIPGELECIIADPGLIFNKHCMMNDDEFRSCLDRRSGRDVKPPSEQVICTVGLGLMMGKEDYEDEAHILLKPKVVLHGALV